MTTLYSNYQSLMYIINSKIPLNAHDVRKLIGATWVGATYIYLQILHNTTIIIYHYLELGVLTEKVLVTLQINKH